MILIAFRTSSRELRMAKQPQTQTPVDIGLNLSGNALGSLTDLVTRMLELREAASGVGAVLKAVNADIEKMDKAAGRKRNPLGVNVLKQINKEADLMMTSPAMVESQMYARAQRMAQAQNEANIRKMNLQSLSKPAVMQSTIQMYGAKTVKKVLSQDLEINQINGNTKATQQINAALDSLNKVLLQSSIKMKSLFTIKTLQEQAAADFLAQPMSELAVKTSAKARLDRNYVTAADEKAINQYMANPKTLKPSANPLSGGTTAQSLVENTQKTAATQRLMGRAELAPHSAARTKELATYNKILLALQEERVLLKETERLKKQSAIQAENQLRAMRSTVNEQERLRKLQETLNSNFIREKNIDKDTINGLSDENFAARRATATARLAMANKAHVEAQKLGNAQAIKDSGELLARHKQEVDLINQRAKAERALSNEQKSSAEISGMRLANRMSFLRDFALLGAAISTVMGSYTFLRDFEVALKQTQAISQATDTQMRALSSSILSVAENSRFSAVEITEAATALAQAGFSMSEIETSLESVTVLATATGSSLKETVDIATASLGAFQLSAENMPKIANQITQAMNLSKLDIQKFQLAVQYAGNAASDAGLDFEELLSSVATVANAGVRSGSTLGTGFRQLLTDLVAPSEKFSAILTRLGLSASDVDIRTNGLVGALKNLREAGFTTADAYQSFEVRSVAFYTALSNNLETYDSLSGNLDNNTAAMDANEIQMNSLAAQTDRMTNQFKAFVEVAGGGVREILTDLFRTVGDLMVRINELANNGFVRFTVQTIAMTTALTGAVFLIRSAIGALVALGGIYKAATAAVVTHTAATTTSGLAARGAAAGMATLRAAMIGTIPQVALIAALVSGAVLAFKYFTKANDDLKNSLENSRTAVNTLNDAIGNVQTQIQETDKKIISLESRFESLKDDPAAVATEMAKLKDRAAELGVSLGTDLTNNIESVRLGWERLRIELSKELIVNLDSQKAELQNLLYLQAQTKAKDLRKTGSTLSSDNTPDWLGPVSDLSGNAATGGSRAWLKNMLGGGGLGDNRAAASAASLTDLFNVLAAADKSKGGSATGLSIQAQIESIEKGALSLETTTQEEAKTKVPRLKENINGLNRMLNNARTVFQHKATVLQGEQKEAADQMLTNINNLIKQMDPYIATINQFSSTMSQIGVAENQAVAETASLKIRTQVADMRKAGVKGVFETSSYGNLNKYMGGDAKALSADQLKRIKGVMPYYEAASRATGVPLDLLLAQSQQESSFGPSNKLGVHYDGTTTDAVGLMQVRAGAAKSVGMRYEDIKNNDENNIMAGAKYLAQKYKQFGNWEDALRAYYMGAGGLQRYKDTNGKSYALGYKQSEKYVKAIAPNIKNFQATGGRSVVQGSIDIPENVQTNLNLIEQVKLMRTNAATKMEKDFGKDVDPTKLNATQQIAYKTATAELAELQEVIDELQGQTHNAIQAAQTKDTEERKLEREAKQFALEEVKVRIAELEQQLKSVKEISDVEGVDYEQTVAAAKLFDELKALQIKQAQMTSDMTKFEAVTYLGDKRTLGNYVVKSADLKLESDVKNINLDIDEKRKKWLKDAAKSYAEIISKQNKLFIEQINTEIGKAKNQLEAGVQLLDFYKQYDTWQIEDQFGLGDKKAQRSIMDDPRYKDRYSSLQREEQTRQINETGLDAFAELERADIEKRIQHYQEQAAFATQKIQEAQKKQAELSDSLKANAAKITDKDISAAAVSEINAEQTKLTSELKKAEAEIQSWGQVVRDLQQREKGLNPENKPKVFSVGETVVGIVGRNQRNMESEEQKYNDINSVLGAVQSSFDNLLTTAWEASDSFDDFFKILTGGSKESSEAFKAFGYSILQSMLRVLQDKITQQFMEILTNGLFGGNGSGGATGALGGTKTGGILSTIGSGIAGALWGPSSTRIGQQASPQQESGGGFWGEALQVVGSIASAWLGGGTGAAATAAVTGGARAVTSGGMKPRRYSQGGLVKGMGAPNVDTIPALLAPQEYVLPKDVTDTVGMGFLEKLRADPAGVVNSKYNMGKTQAAPVKPPSNTNVYVVQPNNVPKSLSPNDVVVTVADNLARNGQLKQLIKQIANE